MGLELHQVLDNIRVQVIKLINEKEEVIKTSIGEAFQRNIEPEQITYAIRILLEMEDKCNSVEETIENLKTRHTELCKDRTTNK